MKKINKLKTIIILVSLICFIILGIIAGSIVCAIMGISWPTEIVVGLVSSLIVALFPLCNKILEKHNETKENIVEKEEKTI
jgi:hypothetical protein